MNANRLILGALLLLVPLFATAQAWVKPYENGLLAAKQGRWADARTYFEEALSKRAEDTDRPSQVGESVASRRPWRAGAPYTPNFAVAYSNFKLAAEESDPTKRTEYLNAAIAGFQSLVDKKQISIDTLVLLAAAYQAVGNKAAAATVEKQLASLDPTKAFKVDREVLEQGDLAAMAMFGEGTSGQDPGSIESLQPGVGSRTGIVPVIETKYALLIGNSQGSNQPFAEHDVEHLSEALNRHAGYAMDNIIVLKNVSCESLMEQAKALAERMPENATLFLFFSGAGVHDVKTGKDYLACTDTPSMTAYSNMIGKLELYNVFVSKGTSIFAFFQVDRPLGQGGKHFGLEVPIVGRIAQSHGCAPGERSFGVQVDGKPQGVYATAMSRVLGEMRSNVIPVLDFQWNVFYKVRSGAADGGGGAQTPTLPVVSSLSSSSRF
jgi:tetratricopeptide (TPR) repeat protein